MGPVQTHLYILISLGALKPMFTMCYLKPFFGGPKNGCFVFIADRDSPKMKGFSCLYFLDVSKINYSKEFQQEKRAIFTEFFCWSGALLLFLRPYYWRIDGVC